LAGPLLQYTEEKWKIGAAFAAAALIHLAAIGLVGLFHREAIDAVLELVQGDGDVEVTFEQASLVEKPPPPPEEDIPPPPPNPDEWSVPEEKIIPPPVRKRASKPIAKKAASGIPGSATSSSAKAVILSAPYPDYPADAREQRITGHGMVLMMVDPGSGSVTHVSMLKSTGNSSLDHAALRGFRRWRFKPGSVTRVKSPVTFALTGVSS
jgi:protein TonB